MILTAARTMVQAHGYNGLSFRELAKEVGVKSASVHYHFPTKGDLGAELARLYRAAASADLEAIASEHNDPSMCLTLYAGQFRRALERGNRMCLCGMMAAEHDALPDAVKMEVRAFAGVNVAWLAKVLARVKRRDGFQDYEDWALAVFAAIGGAQLAARSQNEISVYDRIVETYRACGLMP